MIKSMTAFARMQVNEAFGTLVCELRGVNHRFLELHLRLPDELRAQEAGYREIISGRLKRGKVECNVRLQLSKSHSGKLDIDQLQAKAVVDACHMVNDLLRQPSEVNSMDVLNWPGVVQEVQPDIKPVYAALEKLLRQALEELIKNRLREGERLATILQQRCESMQQIVNQTRENMPQIQQRYREKIQAKLAELTSQIDHDRMEQELLHFLQKMDVEEELDRLDCHLKEIQEVLLRDEAVGRRLDFLMQELNREANTLGSKSVDITSTQASVELKVLIEQMREQIQNIE